MEEIIVLGFASILALGFGYKMINLFKGHNPELEEENKIN
jgi:hypothetical protein